MKRAGPLLLLLPLLGGCALPALIHDKILGPVSPAGELHAVTVGGNFTVTDEGVSATLPEGSARLNPVPREFIRRIGQPVSFYFIVKGLQAGFAGFSPVVRRDIREGRIVTDEQLARALPGVTASQVLKTLGAPNLWIRREGGSIMAYRANVSTSLSLYFGVPPLVDRFIPVPGVGNLRFRYTMIQKTPHKSILFFDGDDVLIAAFNNSRSLQALEASE